MNPMYPNDRCDVCGWGLDDDGGCCNPECQEYGNRCDDCCPVIGCMNCGPCEEHDS